MCVCVCVCVCVKARATNRSTRNKRKEKESTTDSPEGVANVFEQHAVVLADLVREVRQQLDVHVTKPAFCAARLCPARKCARVCACMCVRMVQHGGMHHVMYTGRDMRGW